MSDDIEFLPFPSGRNLVVDAGYLASGRHIIHGLVEVDVTRAREALDDLSQRRGARVSFTAFLVACMGRAIQADLRVQAIRDVRGRLAVFPAADIVTLVEPEAGQVAIPHIIRDAGRKTVLEISDEIRLVQARPDSSPQGGGLVSLGARLPRFARMLFYRILKKNPQWYQRIEGTAVITSVGMFGKGGGWGLGFLPVHTLGLTVGGIATKPGSHEGAIQLREYLHLTISFDHDIVDGAPAARFSRRLVDEIESAAVILDPKGRP